MSMAVKQGGVSGKLAVLLSRRPDERVLLVGSRAVSWAPDFGEYFVDAVSATSWELLPAAAQQGAKFGLVTWDATDARDTKEVFTGLTRARACLAHGGVLFLIVSNRWSPRSAKAVLTQGARLAPGGLRNYTRLLARAGFGAPDTYLPLPSLLDPEEFVTRASAAGELSSYSHAALRATARLGLYAPLHDGFVFLASDGPKSPTSALLDQLTSDLAALGGPKRIALERFDLRQRGALVLLLTAKPRGPKLVARIALRGSESATVGRNAAWTSRLLRDPRTASTLGRWIPRPIGNFAHGNIATYIEERLDGVLAWKVASHTGIRAAIDADALSFLNALASATTVEHASEGELAGRLLDEALAEVAPSLSHFPQLAEAARDLALAIRSRLETGARSCVGHGDFGYGNLVVNRKTGHLTGVIDWDCAREVELPGADWANLLFQRHLQLHGGPLRYAVRAVWRSHGASDGGGGEWPGTAAGNVDRGTLIALAALRYALRTARYPEELTEQAPELEAVADWVLSEYGL